MAINLTKLGEDFLTAVFSTSPVSLYITFKNYSVCYNKMSILRFESEDFVGPDNIAQKLSSIKVSASLITH